MSDALRIEIEIEIEIGIGIGIDERCGLAPATERTKSRSR